MSGCYAPSPPTGAYRCAPDNACPSGQHCTCGLCVDHDSEAACKFSIEASGTTGGVGEHAFFPVTITALQADGKTPASGFSDTVSLSFVLPDGSRWCDVAVQGSSGSTVALKNGSANAMVSLNRETIPPQRPVLRADFGANSGSSSGIQVNAPAFVRDANPTVAPVKPGSAFGWADAFVAEPAVIPVSGGFRMYFSGLALKTGERVSLGVATSSDGKSFTAMPMQIFKPADNTFYSVQTTAPAPFFSSSGVSLAFSGTDQSGAITTPTQIGLATSTDGLQPFAIANGGQPILRRGGGSSPASCDYCDQGIDFPQVLDDPASVTSDGGLGGKLMFFSASQKNNTPTIGRASSADGVTWTAEPAPVLSGDLGGEALLVSPHVLVDGTVFKMWYSFARFRDFKLGAAICDTPIEIGYATSSDGFYWVRSPTNASAPPVGPVTSGWDTGVVAFLAGSAVPTDGSNAGNGISVYYTTVRHSVATDPTSPCLPNGIGRATRP